MSFAREKSSIQQTTFGRERRGVLTFNIPVISLSPASLWGHSVHIIPARIFPLSGQWWRNHLSRRSTKLSGWLFFLIWHGIAGVLRPCYLAPWQRTFPSLCRSRHPEFYHIILYKQQRFMLQLILVKLRMSVKAINGSQCPRTYIHYRRTGGINGLTVWEILCYDFFLSHCCFRKLVPCDALEPYSTDPRHGKNQR